MYTIHPAMCFAPTFAALRVPMRLLRQYYAIGYKPLTNNTEL